MGMGNFKMQNESSHGHFSACLASLRGGPFSQPGAATALCVRLPKNSPPPRSARPKAGTPLCPVPYRQLAPVYRRFPNLLYRRFPNRRTVRVPGAPVWCTACGLGNPRDGRLGSLRYEKTAPGRPLHLKPINAHKVQAAAPPYRMKPGLAAQPPATV